jgi:hypothetical protein
MVKALEALEIYMKAASKANMSLVAKPIKPTIVGFLPTIQEQAALDKYNKDLKAYNDYVEKNARYANIRDEINRLQSLVSGTETIINQKNPPKPTPTPTPTGTGTGGSSQTKAQKEFEEFKRYIDGKKALNQISLNDEIKAYQRFRSKYQANSADQIEIRKELTEMIYSAHKSYLSQLNSNGLAEIQKQKELNNLSYIEADGRITTFESASKREVYALQKHYTKIAAERSRLLAIESKYASISIEEVDKAKDELIRARIAAIDEALQEEKEEVLEKLNERNQAELDAVNKFYDDKIDLVDKKLNQLRSKYDEQDRVTEEFDLMEERAFLSGSISKEAIDRAKEIDERLEAIRREREIIKAEEEAETERANLQQAKDDAVKAQEDINSARLKQHEIDWQKTSENFKSQAGNINTSVSSIISSIEGQSNNVKVAGTNFMKSLVDGIASMKDPLKNTVNEIGQILKATNIGGMTLSGGSLAGLDVNRMSNPSQGLNNTNQVIFNAPLLTVNEMVMSDKIDAQILSSQLFDATQKVIRSSGGSLIGMRV